MRAPCFITVWPKVTWPSPASTVWSGVRIARIVVLWNTMPNRQSPLCQSSMAGCPGTVLNEPGPSSKKGTNRPTTKRRMWQNSPGPDGRVVAEYEDGDGTGAVGCGADRPREYSHEDLASHRDRPPERAGLPGGLRSGKGSTSGATSAAGQPRSRRAGPCAASSATGRPFGAAASSDYARRTCAGGACDTVGRACRAARLGRCREARCGIHRCRTRRPLPRGPAAAARALRASGARLPVGNVIRREGDAPNRFNNWLDAGGSTSQ